MEVKATLEAPYTEKQKVDFIIQQNHNKGYEIRGTQPETLTAWGYTDTEQLEQAKQEKYQEALTKANEFINNVATYRDIECTDGNISKLTAYLFAIQQGLYTTVIWVTKSDETVVLTLDDITDILENIGKIQTDVWSNQYITYKQDIDSATTIEEVKAIEIDYTSNI